MIPTSKPSRGGIVSKQKLPKLIVRTGKKKNPNPEKQNWDNSRNDNINISLSKNSLYHF